MMLKRGLRWVIKVLFRVRVVLHATPEIGARTLFIANHQSLLDGLMLALFLPVQPTFLVHSSIVKRPFFRLLLTLVDHYPIDPTSPMTIKSIIRLIEAGKPVAIFPEGRITVTGGLMKVYDGSAFVAARTGAAIIPVGLSGLTESRFSYLSGKYPRRFFPQVSVHIFPARHIALADGSAKTRRRKAGEGMRRIMQEMIFNMRPQQSLFQAFLSALRRHGRKHPVLEDVRMTEENYTTVLKNALGLGRATAAWSIPGQAVGIMLPNVAPTVSLFLGLSLMQRIPAMLNFTAGPDSVRHALQVAAVQDIITARRFVDTARLQGLIDTLSQAGYRIHYLEDLPTTLSWVDKLWVGFNWVFPAWIARRQASPQSPAVVLYTSGSEGKPKGVVHSHDALLANACQVRAVTDFMPSDKFMVALPLFHSFGLTCGVLLPLINGSRVFLYPSPLHYRIIPELVYDRDCTVLFGTSTFLGNYAKFAHPFDFCRLRYVVSGAEKLSDIVRETWMDKFGVRILEGYGITECAPVVAVNTPMAQKKGAVGTFLPGIEHWLETVPGVEDAGVLHVKGANVMLGYLRTALDRPSAAQTLPQPENNGEDYNTGDIVSVDDDGFVFIKGRAKRFAKLAGEMISLEVVERLGMLASPACFHAASSRPDAAKGEALVLFTTDPHLTREALLAIARAGGYPELAVPRDLRLIPAIPLLGTGKTDYVTLKTLAATA